MTNKAKEKAIRMWIEKTKPENEVEARRMLEVLDCRSLLLPLVQEDLTKGTSMAMVATRYDLSVQQVWRMGESVGVYPKYKAGI